MPSRRDRSCRSILKLARRGEGIQATSPGRRPRSDGWKRVCTRRRSFLSPLEAVACRQFDLRLGATRHAHTKSASGHPPRAPIPAGFRFACRRGSTPVTAAKETEACRRAVHSYRRGWRGAAPGFVVTGGGAILRRFRCLLIMPTCPHAFMVHFKS